MSSALPWGTPSTTSTRTTSPNSLYARLTAQLAPTFPPPTTVILFRMYLSGFCILFAGFLTSLVKQEVKRLVGADVPADARQAAFLLKLRAGNGQGFALLAGDPRNLAIDLFLCRCDGFALADLIQNERRLYIFNRPRLLGLPHFLPIQLDLVGIHALR